MTFVIIFIIIIVILGIIANHYLNERQKKLDTILKNIDDFSASFIVKNTGLYMFCVDENNRKILYLENDTKKHLFNFENVISVEIKEDSHVVYSKSSMRIIGGAVIGGAVGGGVGAIVGGLSGKNKGKKKIEKIEVKILLRNYSTPAIYIDCWKEYEDAQKISDKLSVIIDLIDREEKTRLTESSMSKSISNNSITDEIEKLYSLKEKGIISDEEFTKLKESLL